MRNSFFVLVSVGVLSACVAADVPEPAGAGASLSIVVTHPDREPIEYVVECSEGVASVTPAVEGVDAVAACAALSDPLVVDRLVGGPRPDLACTQIYGGPDLASVGGVINGEVVDVTIGRTDGCGIADWDDLLADILPPPLGVTS